MGRNSLSLKFILRDKRNMTYLFFTTIVCYAAIFILFNVIYLFEMVNSVITGSIVLSVTFIAIYISWYVNSLSLENRRREIAIEIICGLSRGRVLRLTLLQQLIMCFISTIFAFLFAIILTPILVKLVCVLLRTEMIVFSISLEAFLVSIFIILLQFIFLIFNNGGMVFRNEPIDLFNKEKGLDFKNLKTPKVINLVSILCFLGPSIMAIFMIFKPDIELFYRYTDLMSIMGLIGIIKFTIPSILDNLARKRFTVDKENLLVVRRIKNDIEKGLGLVIGFGIIRFLISILNFQNISNIEGNILGIIGNGMILILCTTALIYNNIFMSENRKIQNSILEMLGYDKMTLQKIAMKNLLVYWSIIVILPLVQMFRMLFVDILILGIINVSFYIFIGLYIVTNLLGLFIIMKWYE